MTILERVDELRNQRGWSVNYLAMEAGLTQSTLNNLYARNAEPKISTLRAICGAFGITLAQFFSGMEEGGVSKDSELLSRVTALTEKQKNALMILLCSMQ